MIRKYIIYKVTNKINGKSYIGFTIRTLKQRMYHHYYAARRNKHKGKFHNALLKYTPEDWEVCILEENEADKPTILEREQYFVTKYDSYNNGYNATPGGDDFLDPEYQKQNQYRRIANGTHPFVGGEIQRLSSKTRWENGTHCFIGLNQKRIQNGDHNLVGENNPQKQRKQRGEIHHNQQSPWDNTKCTTEAKEAWLIADKLYSWWKENNHKKRGGSYTAMMQAFNLNTSLQVMYYKYFSKGWVPSKDESWVQFKQDHK